MVPHCAAGCVKQQVSAVLKAFLSTHSWPGSSWQSRPSVEGHLEIIKRLDCYTVLYCLWVVAHVMGACILVMYGSLQVKIIEVWKYILLQR